jgi:spore coat protein A, manganese oxidase
MSRLLTVSAGPGYASTGLVGPDGVTYVTTPIWGYGTPQTGHTWPGRTFQVQSNVPTHVRWVNRIPIADGYLLTGINNNEGNFAGRSVVDTSIHYCYSIRGYSDYTIETHGTPIVTHVHGGHTDAEYDGNAESFFTPRFAVTGPAWPGRVYEYDNSQPAAALWYHDHALGLTRYVLQPQAGVSEFMAASR